MGLDDNKSRPRELSTTEAAAYCGYTIHSFYLRVNEIRHRKERGRLYFSVDALDEFKAAQSTERVPAEAAS